MCVHPCCYFLMPASESHFHIQMCISAKEWPAPVQNGNENKVPCKNVAYEGVPEINIWYPSGHGSSNLRYVLACFQETCRRRIESARLYGCNIQAQTQTLIKCCVQIPMGGERTRQHFSLRIKKKGQIPVSSPDIVFPSIFFIIVVLQLPVILSAGHLSQPAKVSVQMSNNRAEWRLRSTRPDVSGARAALGPLVEMVENTTMDRFNTVLWALWGCPCRCYGWQNEAHPFSAAWTMTRGLWGQW